jgi:hypothetical protein
MELPLIDIGMVAGAAGYVASQFIDIAKPFIIRYLADDIETPALKLASLTITGLCALGLGYGAEQIGFLDAGGMWLVVLASFPAAGGWFQLESRRKAAKAK